MENSSNFKRIQTHDLRVMLVQWVIKPLSWELVNLLGSGVRKKWCDIYVQLLSVDYTIIGRSHPHTSEENCLEDCLLYVDTWKIKVTESHQCLLKFSTVLNTTWLEILTPSTAPLNLILVLSLPLNYHLSFFYCCCFKLTFIHFSFFNIIATDRQPS